jgi:hypothetical protein
VSHEKYSRRVTRIAAVSHILRQGHHYLEHEAAEDNILPEEDSGGGL